MERAIEEIRAERAAQDVEWGGPDHDDQHTAEVWLELIQRKVYQADGARMRGDGEWLRRRLVQTAALCVAALEAFERAERTGN